MNGVCITGRAVLKPRRKFSMSGRYMSPVDIIRRISSIHKRLHKYTKSTGIDIYHDVRERISIPVGIRKKGNAKVIFSVFACCGTWWC